MVGMGSLGTPRARRGLQLVVGRFARRAELVSSQLDVRQLGEFREPVSPLGSSHTRSSPRMVSTSAAIPASPMALRSRFRPRSPFAAGERASACAPFAVMELSER